ncbi:MAG: Gfo/Idh/MocA family oxidoreductase [Bacteroidales bacterium]
MIKTGICGDIYENDKILDNVLDIPELSLVGFYSPDLHTKEFKEKSKIKSYTQVESLLNDVDAVIALSPLTDSFHLEKLVKNSKHVYFEPSSKCYTEDFNKLNNIIDEANVKVQAGLHHRFNNTFLSAKPFIKKPKFIQSKNFKRFNFDIDSHSVLMDLLIPDIDIVLSLISSNIKNIKTSATSLNYSDPDIINVRLEFMNGSVADLTASRIAAENSHEISFYCDKNYVQLDLYNNNANLLKKRDPKSSVNLFQENVGDLIVEKINIKPNNSYFDEFSSFAKSIVYDKEPEADVDKILKTYKIIDMIKDKLKLETVRR